MTVLHPKNLLLSKWTAVKPVARQKHFLVSTVIPPEPPDSPVLWVDIESVYSKKVRRIQWRELLDEAVWKQGWL